MIHTLENDQLRIKIADHGAELSEIYDKTNDRQVLWNADPAYWKRHAPVLFPNVGRYYEDHCLINGRSYTSARICPRYGIYLHGQDRYIRYTSAGIHRRNSQTLAICLPALHHAYT